MEFLANEALDKEITAALLTCDITCEKAEVDFNLAMVSLNSYMEAEEAEPARNGKFLETVRKIFAAIKKALEDGISAIAKIFDKKEMKASDIDEIKLSYDLAEIYKATEGDFNEGSRLIEALARESKKEKPVSPADVERFIIKHKDQTKYILNKTISTATAMHWYDKFCTDGAIHPFKSQLQRADAALSDIKDPDLQRKAVKVALAMRYSMRDYLSTANVCVSELKRQL